MQTIPTALDASRTGPAPGVPLLDLRDVRLRFGDHEVLRGIDLTVPTGVTALLGANGAGKTTLLRVPTTLARPDSGRVSVCGVDAIADPAAARRFVRVTAQAATVDDALTGRENLVLFGRLLGRTARSARTRADELIDRFALASAADRRAATYSGGMRRRLDLAVSLVDTAPLLVLDEPTTGLDPAGRAELWDVIRETVAAGTSVLFTTQLLTEAEAVADVVAVVHAGRIAAIGTPAELTARVGSGTVRLRRTSGELVRSIPSDGTARGIAGALNDLAAPDLDLRVELDRPTLDDAFAAITGTRTTRSDAAARA